MLEPANTNIMEISIKKEIMENDEITEPINSDIMEIDIKEEPVESDDEMTEEICYFCGYPVQLEPGQFTVQCGLCSETVTFEKPNDNTTCPFCKSAIKQYLGAGPNRCEVCANILNDQPFLGDEKPFMCDVCGKRLGSKYRLGKHSKKHMTPRLQCKYCPQLFTRNSERRTHERYHPTDMKNFQCDVCGVSFFRLDLFRRHKTIHNSEPVDPDDCPQNGKTSSLRTSAGKLPYFCSFCGLTIQTKEYLYQHIDEHRKNFPNKCFICGLIFPEVDHLKNHVCNPSTEDPYIKSKPTVRSRRRSVRRTGVLENIPQKDILGTSGICHTPTESENSVSPLQDRHPYSTQSNISSAKKIKITTRVRNEIKYQVKKGMSEKEVAEILNVSENVISNICWPKCDPELVKCVVKLVQDDRFLSLVQMTEMSNISREDVNVYGGTTIIQRILDESGYSFTNGASDPLDEDSRSQRLAWAERHATWTKEDWSKVLWTGTVKFRRFATSPPYNRSVPKSYREHIWRLPNEDPSEKVIQSSSTGEESLHMWGCMSGGGFGELCRISGSFDSASYLTILKDSMFPCAFSLIGPDFILQHENDSEQAQDLQVQMWLSSPARDLDIMEWPANGTDINPLENVWNKLCPELDGLDSDDVEELFKKIEFLIREIPNSFYINLMDTMKNRCQALVDGRGGYINCV